MIFIFVSILVVLFILDLLFIFFLGALFYLLLYFICYLFLYFIDTINLVKIYLIVWYLALLVFLFLRSQKNIID